MEGCSTFDQSLKSTISEVLCTVASKQSNKPDVKLEKEQILKLLCCIRLMLPRDCTPDARFHCGVSVDLQRGKGGSQQVADYSNTRLELVDALIGHLELAKEQVERLVPQGTRGSRNSSEPSVLPQKSNQPPKRACTSRSRRVGTDHDASSVYDDYWWVVADTRAER